MFIITRPRSPRADAKIRKDLRAIAPSGVISKRQVLAAASKAEARGDHRGAEELRTWMRGFHPDRLHRWDAP